MERRPPRQPWQPGCSRPSNDAVPARTCRHSKIVGLSPKPSARVRLSDASESARWQSLSNSATSARFPSTDATSSPLLSSLASSSASRSTAPALDVGEDGCDSSGRQLAHRCPSGSLRFENQRCRNLERFRLRPVSPFQSSPAQELSIGVSCVSLDSSKGHSTIPRGVLRSLSE